MKHSKLKAYLANPQLAKDLPFSEDEIMEIAPEALLSVYMIIRAAIRDQNAIIEVTENETLERKPDGLLVKRMQTLTDLRSLFEFVRKRDIMINSSLHLVSASDDSLTYQIV